MSRARKEKCLSRRLAKSRIYHSPPLSLALLAHISRDSLVSRNGVEIEFPRKPCNKSFIDQVCSVKMAGYWLDIGLRVYGPRLRLGP